MGVNIAIKIPKVHYEKTIAFYRDVLGLPVVQEKGGGTGRSYSCKYGPNKLWFDLVEHYSQTDVWLELEADDIDLAAKHLQDSNVPLRDEMESLEGLKAHWISSPAGTVHLLVQNG